MKRKKWFIDKGNSGALIMGAKPKQLPEQAYISITRGEGLNFFQVVINQVLTLMVMSQMRKVPGLMYAELKGDLIKGRGYGQTMTVWDGKTMPDLRNNGNHGFAMKWFTWVVHRKNTKNYYLTYQANGKIPSIHEAKELVKEYGKYYDGGKLTRKASPPKTGIF